jgi:regulator of sirC expression with transglutaminase-like and TPR domain
MHSFSLQSERARALLAEALGAEPPRLDLAACAVASLNDETLDVNRILSILDGYGERVRAHGPEKLDALGRVQALRRVLSDEEGFWGDTESYESPENSFLDRVLARKKGLPITLAVVYLEVARRAGIPLFGVSFPGHFLVACPSEEGKLVVDPFQGGTILTEAGCQDLLARVAPQVKFQPRLLSAAPVKIIAWRMLTNVKRAWLERADGERAARAVDLLLALHPDHPGELRARATILSALGAYKAALADVERCLKLSPDAPDQIQLEMTAQALRYRLELLN